MHNLLLGLTILVIGDSHFAHERYLITTLHDDMTTEGAKVATYGACGMTASAWVSPRTAQCGIAERTGTGPVVQNMEKTAQTWSIDTLIQTIRPNVVIVGIGDTMAAYNQKELPRAAIADSVNALVAHIKAANVPCFWIGPDWGTEGGPYFKTFERAKELSDYLKTVVTPCQYIDSLNFEKPGEWSTFDGLHHTSVGYNRWGAAITEVLVQNATIRGLVKH